MKRVGILGFGEVGSCFAGDLKLAGADVMAYDKYWDVEPAGERIRRRSAETGVPLAQTVQTLGEWAEVIISVTVPVAALEAAVDVAPSLRSGQIFADFSSAVPAVKRHIERLVAAQGCDFVDGGILGSPRLSGHRVPIVVSGPRAEALVSVLNGFNMQLTLIGHEVGQASALKVIRSVFTKGFEAVLLECLVASETFGIREAIMRSLVEFLAAQPPEQLFELLITSHAVHAHRRAGEMEGVFRLLRAEGIDAVMTEATWRKLQWSAALRVVERATEKPRQLRDVIPLVAALSRGAIADAETRMP